MYNHQLETFIQVADAGSFNKAAAEAFITPTAIIKQINLLEDSLGVKLFQRSHRGLTLTKAGISLYNDARYIIQYCRDTGEKRHAGGCRGYSHWNLAHHACTGIGGSVAPNTQLLPGY